MPRSFTASPAPSTIRVPRVQGASDCNFLGLAIAVDNHHFSVNPLSNTIFGAMGLLPDVSVNPTLA